MQSVKYGNMCLKDISLYLYSLSQLYVVNCGSLWMSLCMLVDNKLYTLLFYLDGKTCLTYFPDFFRIQYFFGQVYWFSIFYSKYFRKVNGKSSLCHCIHFLSLSLESLFILVWWVWLSRTMPGSSPFLSSWIKMPICTFLSFQPTTAAWAHVVPGVVKFSFNVFKGLCNLVVLLFYTPKCFYGHCIIICLT